MPSIKVLLDEVFKNKNFGKTDDQKKALDALLAANSTNYEDIKNAISDYKNIWGEFDTIDEKDDTTSLVESYQLASERKITLALAKANVEQLTTIINADSLEALNEYFKTDSGKLILGTHAAQIIENKGISTESVKRIQLSAIHHLINNSLRKATLDVRNNFISRCKDKNINTALITLDIEQSIIKQAESIVNNREAPSFFEKIVLMAAIVNINKLDLAKLTDKKGENLNELYQELVPDESSLKTNTIKNIKLRLSKIFVKNQISNTSDEDLLNKIVSADDNEQLSVYLNKTFNLSGVYQLTVGDNLKKELRDDAKKKLDSLTPINNDESKNNDNSVAPTEQPSTNNSPKAAPKTSQDFQNLLEKCQDEFKKMDKNYQAIINSDTSVRPELMNLARLKDIKWLPPVPQAADFKTLSNHCDFVIKEFDLQIEALEKHSNSLLDEPIDTYKMPSKQKQAFRNYLGQVNSRLEDLHNGWMLYNSIQDVLKGNDKATNPLLQQGLIKTLEHAQKNNGDVKILPFRYDFEDFEYSKANWDACFNDKRDITAFIDKAMQSSPPKINTTIVNKAINDETTKSNDQKYRQVLRVANSSFRQYTVTETVGGQEVAGQFLEQRLPASANKNKLNHSSDTTSHMKITINKFPPKSAPTARVAFSLAVASQYLAAHGKPTKDNPIILNGNDDGDLESIEEMKYLYTAFMAIKKNDPHMNFDEKAIEVTGSFKPASENVFWPKKNLYEREFKNNPKLTSMISGIKAINEAKYDNLKTYHQINDNGKKITQAFKRLNKEQLAENRPKEIEQPAVQSTPRTH